MANSVTSDSYYVPLKDKPTLVRIGCGVHGKNPNERVMRYQMKNIWSVHLYTYEAQVTINGQAYPIRPNYVSLTPPGAALEWRFKGPSFHISTFFSFPTVAKELVRMPPMQDAGEMFPHLYRDLEEALRFFPLQRQRAEVRVWNILWNLAGNAEKSGEYSLDMHPAVSSAVAVIESNLSEHLAVSAICNEVGVSKNHLVRLFHQSFNMTVIEYIRRRRAEMAWEMLVNSSMPIKAIAHYVGIPDVQHFYKTMKREYGLTPGDIRKGAVPEISKTVEK